MVNNDSPDGFLALVDALVELRDALLEPFVPIVEWLIEKLGRC